MTESDPIAKTLLDRAARIIGEKRIRLEALTEALRKIAATNSLLEAKAIARAALAREKDKPE